MTVCNDISNEFPELKRELLAAIEDVLIRDGERSKGILSRGSRVLRLLKKVLMDI